MIWDGVVSARTRTSSSGAVDDDTTTGLDDVRVGGKLRLVRRPRFAAAFIAYVNVPVGSMSSPTATPTLTRLAWSLAISDHTWVNGTADLQAVREDDGEVRAKPALSAALGRVITAVLDGFCRRRRRAARLRLPAQRWSVEAGLVRALGERHQVGVWASRRISGDVDGWFISAGFIRRLR